ncbi:STAS/SEC14 domain-containing protein [Nannocystaceae bacterium ST9]
MSPDVLDTQLRGHLTRDELDRSLGRLVPRLKRIEDKVAVLIDCREMSGYDLDARHAFVEWNSQWRSRIRKVAIVTSNRLYHVVIAGMALASGQAMRGFADEAQALAWAREP